MDSKSHEFDLGIKCAILKVKYLSIFYEKISCVSILRDFLSI